MTQHQTQIVTIQKTSKRYKLAIALALPLTIGILWLGGLFADRLGDDPASSMAFMALSVCLFTVGPCLLLYGMVGRWWHHG